MNRRSFFTGLTATLLAPKMVQRALAYVAPRNLYAGLTNATRQAFVPRLFVQTYDKSPLTDLLKQRISSAEFMMRETLNARLYSDDPGGVARLISQVLPYQMLRETLLEQSEHHFQRAAYWRIQGKPDYAMGSLHKAARAEDRARSLPG